MTKGDEFRCEMHWQSPWSSPALRAYYAELMEAYCTLLSSAAEIEEGVLAEWCQTLAEYVCYAAAYVAWYGRVDA